MCHRKSSKSKMAFYAKRAIIKLIRKQKLDTIYFGVSFKLFQSIGLLIIFSYDYELIKQPTFFRKLKRATVFFKRATFGPRVIGWQPLIYKIPCKDCDDYCIGQTGRPLIKRVKEHEASCCLNNYIDSIGNIKSAPAKHSHDNQHTIDWCNTTILTVAQSRLQLNLLEHAAITCYNIKVLESANYGTDYFPELLTTSNLHQPTYSYDELQTSYFLSSLSLLTLMILIIFDT